MKLIAEAPKYCAIIGGKCIRPIKHKRRQIFIGLPFKKEYIDTKECIKRTIRECKFRPYIAEDEIKEGLLFCRICIRVRESELIFFEVTEWNPNVAFEAGMAIGHHKHVFFISKGNPFTLIEGVQRIQYENLQDLEDKIKSTLSSYMRNVEQLFYTELVQIAKDAGVEKDSENFRILYNRLKEMFFSSS